MGEAQYCDHRVHRRRGEEEEGEEERGGVSSVDIHTVLVVR